METVIITEQTKYQYKSLVSPVQLKADISKPIVMSGSLTFLDSTDALTYYTKIITTIKGADVIYAKIDFLDNSHHWTNDKVQPDAILGQTIFGDVNAVSNLS